jgi:hypothetical protein
MLPGLHRELHAIIRRGKQADRLSAARTHLGRFVLGAKVNNLRYMWELGGCPRGIWEFRVREQIVKDQIRVFGVFAAPNKFLATHMRDRNDLGNDERKWNHAVERVQKEWEALFVGLPWWTGNTFSEYVTLNSEDQRAQEEARGTYIDERYHR